MHDLVIYFLMPCIFLYIAKKKVTMKRENLHRVLSYMCWGYTVLFPEIDQKSREHGI